MDTRTNALKMFFLAAMALVLSGPLNSCGPAASDKSCGTYNGKRLYLGPKGGCYYLNSSGSKEYVDRNFCAC